MSESVTGQFGRSGLDVTGTSGHMRPPFVRRVIEYLARCIGHFNAFDLASLIAMMVLTFIVLATVQSYAISNDEGLQHHYGELIIAYYKSGFTDQSLFKFDNLYLYGGLFDITAVLLSYVAPIDAYKLRHLLCALIGIGGIGAVAATARMIAGPRAGFFAMAALTLCGSWYGGMFNHTKAIPLAAAMAWATFFIVRAMRDLPCPRLRDIVGFGIMTGAALGIKSLSLLLVGYLGLAILISVPRPIAGHTAARAQFVLASTLRFLPALVIAYLIMIAVWPWAALAPLNPIRGLLSFGDFRYKIHTILFGQFYEMAEVPRYYVTNYLAIRLPLLTLSAALATFALPIAQKFLYSNAVPGTRRRETGFIAFTAIFPVMCEVITQGPALDGCRHFLFVLPPLAILAGIGIHTSIDFLSRISRSASIAGILIVAFFYTWTATKLYALHPYEYLYYNQLVGGLEGASRRFVTDYWVNIMPEAVHELHEFLDRTEPSSAQTHLYRVAVCGERVSYEEYARPNLIRTPDWHRADFYIAPTHMNCDRSLNGKVIAKIERMGVTIGVVKDRRATRSADNSSNE
jgi:hypothetical protein